MPTTRKRYRDATILRHAFALSIIALIVALGFLMHERQFTASLSSPYPDVQQGTLEAAATEALTAQGILSGFPDGTFRGALEVKRAEAAKMILLASGTPVIQARNVGIFSDVREGEWYVSYVITAALRNIFNGYPDGSFRPANTINTAEFLKILSRAFGLPEHLPHTYSDVAGTEWFSSYAGIAMKYSLFPLRTDRLEPGSLLTRSDTAIALYQYLRATGGLAKSTSSSSVTATIQSRSAEIIDTPPPSSLASFASFAAEKSSQLARSSSSRSAPTSSTHPIFPPPVPSSQGKSSASTGGGECGDGICAASEQDPCKDEPPLCPPGAICQSSCSVPASYCPLDCG